MKTFVVPDLHGRHDLLVKGLEAVSHAAQGGTVVFLGDYIDRGPDGRAVLERLMAGPPVGWAWVCLKGNHEDLMVCALETGDTDLWLLNGGEATLASYDGRVDPAHLQWCAQLPVVRTDTHRIYVHAFIDPARPLAEQSAHDMMWRRYDPGVDARLAGFHLVHGHTPHAEGPELLAGRTNLDCLAFGTGRLVIGVFDDDAPGGPVDFIEVEGPAA